MDKEGWREERIKGKRGINKEGRKEGRLTYSRTCLPRRPVLKSY